MKKKYTNKFVFISTVIVIFGFSSVGFAQWGMGQHHYGGMHHGPGWHHHEFGRPNYGYSGDLSDEEIMKIKEECLSFFEATKDIRQDLYQKRLELRSELAKKDPDAARAANLQKDISDLKAQFDQMRLDHMLKMKKINPDFGRGFMGRDRMGFGRMGPRGYGGCPNYPYQGYGRGYGMDPGMRGQHMVAPGYGMGPGMMDHGWGRGMGPGWSVRDYPQHYRSRKGPLEEKDAKAIVENYLRSTRNPNLKLGKIQDAGDVFEAEIVTKDNSLVDKVLVDREGGWIRPTY
ncbi:MAG: periplasmic heavy metal sensor [Desulfobacterales bacterium]|nr:MAG: periplasmic heavy metal sensor [Desulfobacterales bacterium]